MISVDRRGLLAGCGALIACASLLPCRRANAHTSVVTTIQCPIDGTSFQVRETASYTSFGSLRDFQRLGAVGSLYADAVHACPACHFAGYADDFAKPVAPATKRWVLDALQKKYGRRVLSEAEECEDAALRYEFEKARNDAVAELYLIASYLLRSAQRGAELSERMDDQRLAAKFFLLALTKGEVEEKARGTTLYLVGEMYRRVGEHPKAIACFDLAALQPQNPVGLASFVHEQRALAAKGDANNDI
jgi:uncharacterized protein (DUF2225 family)